jgi:hypothetical protein
LETLSQVLAGACTWRIRVAPPGSQERASGVVNRSRQCRGTRSRPTRVRKGMVGLSSIPNRLNILTHRLRSGHGCSGRKKSVPLRGLTSGAGGQSEQRRQSAAERRRRCFVWSGHGGGECKRHVPECRPRDRGHQQRQGQRRAVGSTPWLDGEGRQPAGGPAEVRSRSVRAGTQARAAEMKWSRTKGLWGWALTNAPAVLDRL